ncbi:MAG: hypothetical protein A3I61_17185 [Acidobacteria bacterium RIFCSPLOWO2_02_FULL_68_18]|nr:MAG: hypothetical protein A3I61_17185 [Acidobacteria bacterium RIFCSPLOWO2_02_FULL_68_18]
MYAQAASFSWSAGLMMSIGSPRISALAIGLLTSFSNALSQSLLHLSQTRLVVTLRTGALQRPVVSLPVDRMCTKWSDSYLPRRSFETQTGQTCSSVSGR